MTSTISPRLWRQRESRQSCVEVGRPPWLTEVEWGIFCEVWCRGRNAGGSDAFDARLDMPPPAATRCHGPGGEPEVVCRCVRGGDATLTLLTLVARRGASGGALPRPPPAKAERIACGEMPPRSRGSALWDDARVPVRDGAAETCVPRVSLVVVGPPSAAGGGGEPPRAPATLPDAFHRGL
jgi:hypothetical protein